MADFEDASSAFDISNASDDFVPAVKAKAKAAPKKPSVAKAPKASAPKVTKAPAKKLTQTTLKPAAQAKKRPKSHSDDEEDGGSDFGGDSILSNTPPSAKKQKTSQAKKQGASLVDQENDSVMMDQPAAPKSKGKKTATETYQKLTQLEHVLKRPDTYIGSAEMEEQSMWVFDSEKSEMAWRKVNFVPGLYKIFDEVIVNAADNKQTDKSMNYIKVMVDRETGTISVENNGRGIPVEIHEKERIYIPELIFGHLLAGSNFNDEQAKTTGGRNGYGAKLCNIFSTSFTIETQDSNSGQRYKQTWTDNMSKMGKAKITQNSKSADFTRVTFTPDYQKFKMKGIDDDFEALVKRRVYDMAGTVKGVKVFLNGTQLKVNWKSYIEMYARAINKERGAELENVKDTVIVEKADTHERWEVGFAVSDGSFQQVSFVNNIATTSGGTHVNYIADQICEKLAEVVKKKNSKGAVLKTNQIRNHIFLFVNALITNPGFNSQTKEQLNTRPKQFGSKCILTDEFLKKISKTEAVDNILNFAAKKADQELSKSDGNKRSRINNAKLVDANLAGTKRGHECTLILTEGDSAKGLAVAGRAVLDPDRIGVFPLRGKLLNVRDASLDQITKNSEIQNIKQFLGLKHKQNYTNTLGLRYGHLMIMADQDYDGSHIKGLLINFLQVQFPSLLKLPDFFREFITPIVRVWKGPDKKPTIERAFFTMPQYEVWKERHQGDKSWKQKYYKGLGTSAPEDAQKYFGNLDDHLIEFESIKQEEEELLDLAFSKKKVEARKQWLGNFVPGTYIDHSNSKVTYSDFVNKELILFSMADNVRSVPSIVDGFKPGQRKVMYACFKRNLVNDMKVAELAGYVSENTAYHHGEQSMYSTIIGLAQTFVGSNNVNILEPSGNFGTRLGGGGDAASARYIFTRLSPFARRIFSALDDPLYVHNVDDGKKIEPVTYCPVVPMVLINGADGIGTGWSTSIPNYHPIDVVNNLKRRMGRLEGSVGEEPFQTMMPWFRGWKGVPEEAGPNRYNFNGIAWQTAPNEVDITELPIRMWTDDFKARLEDIIKAEKAPSFIKDYREFNDHNTVHFIIQLEDKHMKAALEEGLAERFKLNKTVATSNLVAFDLQGRIRRYDNVEDILEEFYGFRMEMYTKRKAYWLNKMGIEHRKLQNQVRFVLEIIENKLIVSKKKKAVLVAELRKRNYDPFPKVEDAKKAGESEEVLDNDEEAGDDGGARDFDYLLGMAIWSLTHERVEKMETQMKNKQQEIDNLAALSEKDLWCADLDAFVEEWEKSLLEDAAIKKSIRARGRRVSKKIGAGGGKSSKSKHDDDDFNPTVKTSKPAKADPAKGIIKPAVKPHSRFISAFNAAATTTKPSSSRVATDGADELSDDDFAALAPPEEQAAQTTSEATTGRSKRAAAAAPKAWIENDDDSESEDGGYLGDLGAMVKGIGTSNGQSDAKSSGQVSLYAMSRPGTSHGERPGSSAGLPRAKPKSATAAAPMDLSDADETNYEMLARSPHKTAAARDEVDSFLSSDEDMPLAPVVKSKPAPKPVAKASTTLTKESSVASRSQAAVRKPLTAQPKASQTKIAQLSPAAKAYALKQRKILLVDSDEEEEEDDVAEHAPVQKKSMGSEGKKPAATATKARSAGAAKSTATAAKGKKKTIARSEDEATMDSDSDVVEMSAPAPPAPARGRPARAATTAAKSKPKYVDSDSEEGEGEEAEEDDDGEGMDVDDTTAFDDGDDDDDDEY